MDRGSRRFATKIQHDGDNNPVCCFDSPLVFDSLGIDKVPSCERPTEVIKVVLACVCVPLFAR